MFTKKDMIDMIPNICVVCRQPIKNGNAYFLVKYEANKNGFSDCKIHKCNHPDKRGAFWVSLDFHEICLEKIAGKEWLLPDGDFTQKENI